MVISIDWLSLSCKGIIENKQRIEFIRQEFNTRIFKNVDVLMFDKVNFGVVCSNPHSNILPTNFITIKFDNEILYNKTSFVKIKELLKLLNWEVSKILRFDVCCDFEYFDNNMLPSIFLKRFAKGLYLKGNKTKFQLIGKGNKSGDYEYLKIGSRSSNVCCYLYNKSLEMREKKDKAHIRNTWKLNGINDLFDIWRLEFSVNNSSLNMLDLFTGELQYLNLENIFIDSYIIDLFASLVNKYFVFRLKGKDKNFNRLKKIELFNFTNISRIMYESNELKDSTRMNKYLVKKIDKIFNDYKSLLHVSEDTKIEFLKEYVLTHNLVGFYNSHKSEFSLKLW